MIVATSCTQFLEWPKIPSRPHGNVKRNIWGVLLQLQLWMVTLSSSMEIMIILLHFPKEFYTEKCWILSDYDEYIPRTTKTQLGNPVIIDSDDYMYILHDKRNPKTTTWRCRSCNSLGCKARVTTLKKNGYIIKFHSGHNHPPPPLQIE